MGARCGCRRRRPKPTGSGNYRFGGIADGVYSVYTMPALESEPGVTAVAKGTAAKIVARRLSRCVLSRRARVCGSGAHSTCTGRTGGGKLQPHARALLPCNRIRACCRGRITIRYRRAIRHGDGRHGSPASLCSAIRLGTHTLQTNLPDGTYMMVMQTFQRHSSL
jgi:hypothetical protein